MPDGMSNKIGNVFGVEIPINLQRQLAIRKLNVAKGDVKNNMIDQGEIRDNDTLVYLANKSSWVRLVSSVNIVSTEDMKYFKNYFPNLQIDKPDSLAKEFILFSGTSKYNQAKVQDINSPDGFKNVASYELRYGIEQNGAYNILGDKEWQDYGSRPMPGITDVKIETLGKLGSVRSATINFKAWDKYQLDVVDALYFKMGYTMFLEWGHAVYYNNKGELSTSTYSVVDPFAEGMHKEELARQIAEGVENTNGNYDAMLGMCTNFTFDFNKDGGYDCSMKIIALGGLADAIKVNQSKNLSAELKGELSNIVGKINADAKKKAQEEWLRQNQYQINQRNQEIADAKKQINDEQKKAGDLVLTTGKKSILNIIVDAYKDLSGWKGLFQKPEDVIAVAVKGSDLSQPKGVHIAHKKIGPSPTTTVSLEEGLFYLDSGFTIFADGSMNTNNYEKIIINQSVMSLILESAFELWKQYLELGNQQFMKIGTVVNDGDNILITGYYTKNNHNYGYSLRLTEPKGDTKAGGPESVSVIHTDYDSDGGSTSYPIEITGAIPTDPKKGLISAFFEEAIKNYAYDGEASPNNVAIEIHEDGGENQKSFLNGIKTVKEGTNGGKIYQSKDDKYGSRSSKMSLNSQIVAIDTKFAGTTGGAGSGYSISTTGAIHKLGTRLSVECYDVSLIKSVKLKSTTAVVTSLEFSKLQEDQQKAEILAKASKIEVPKPLEVPELKVEEVTAEEATKYHSNLEYFLRAIQIHSINETFSNTELVTHIIDLEKKDFIYKLLEKGFIPVQVLKEFSNANGSKAPDKWKIENIDSITNYEPRQKLIYSFASYGFNHNLMSRPKYTEDQVKDIAQHDFYNMFTSYVVPYNPTQAIVKDVKIGHPVYIKLSMLLFALNQMCIIYDSPDKKNSEMKPSEQFPMMYLDFNVNTNTCLTEPVQLSTDPYKFLIEFRCTDDDYAKLFAGAVSGIQDDNASSEYINNILKQLKQGGLFKPESEDKLSADLPFFKDVNSGTNGEDAYRGYFMNTLVNIDYLLDLCKKFGKDDESESVYLKPFLQQLISDLGKSLGDINFFRLAYNDQSNCMYITDDQVSPLQPGEKYVPTVNPKAYEASSELPVFGKYSIAKALSIKTEVNNKLSNMLAISANSKNKSSLSKDATPFGKYNENFVDRYKKQAQEITDDSGNQTRIDISNALFFNQFVKLALSTDSPSTDDVPQATNYYIDRMNKRKSINPATKSSAMIPVSVNITFEGISGFYMGHTFTLPDEVLPYTYTRPAVLSNGAIPAGKRVGFVVVGVDHTLQDNQWLTNLRANMIYIKDTRDFQSAVGLNRNKLATGTFESIAQNTAANSVVTNGSNTQESGTGGHPITEKDRQFAEKYTGGVFPAVTLSDDTFAIQNVEGDRKWLKVNQSFLSSLETVDVPTANGISKIQVRPEFADVLNKAFADIKQQGLEKYIKTCAGGLAVRNVTGGDSLSFHAWGFAIDINENIYPYGSKFPNNPTTDQDIGFAKVAETMKKYGIGWLKNSDPMHFSINEIHNA